MHYIQSWSGIIVLILEDDGLLKQKVCFSNMRTFIFPLDAQIGYYKHI